MNKEMNNKGFSLVELIVVIAIMAILAVTLAPRLTQYVEKSRVASDQEAVNTIFSAARLASAETTLAAGSYGLDDFGFTVTNAGKTWTKGATTTPASVDAKFATDFMAVLSSFTLKSSSVATGADIQISATTGGAISVVLDPDGAGSATNLTAGE